MAIEFSGEGQFIVTITFAVDDDVESFVVTEWGIDKGLLALKDKGTKVTRFFPLSTLTEIRISDDD